eukprot:1325640-Rhodomonas_salina.1
MCAGVVSRGMMRTAVPLPCYAVGIAPGGRQQRPEFRAVIQRFQVQVGAEVMSMRLCSASHGRTAWACSTASRDPALGIPRNSYAQSWAGLVRGPRPTVAATAGAKLTDCVD